MFGLGCLTHLAKRVVLGLGLNVSCRKQVGHEHDLQTRFASDSHMSPTLVLSDLCGGIILHRCKMSMRIT